MIDHISDLRALTLLLKAATSDGDGPAEAGKGKSDPDRSVSIKSAAKRRSVARLRPNKTTTALLTEESVFPTFARISPAAPPDGIPPVPPEDMSPATPPPAPLEVLKQALRVAIRLEFATVPPYLTALWSIIDQTHPVAKVIRAVAHEEMLHVAILCNFLSALGERPVLTGEVVPRYPCALPGEVHPELEVKLLGYTREALDIFMEIERPEDPLPIEGEIADDLQTGDKTIGAFYAAILDAYEKILPNLDPHHQIAGPFVWFVLTKPEHVREAITLIMTQGEGSRGRPYTRDPRFLAHYYRFRSLAMAVELVWDEPSEMLKRGKPIDQPSVFTLAPASARGYGLAAPPKLREANDRFESSYSQMLRLLEEAWKDGGHKSFVAALEHMFELTHLAQVMMRMGTPDGRGYCPAFLYRA